MGCGASQPVTKDAMPIEEKQGNGTNMTASTQQNPAGIKTTEHAQTAALPTSMLTPVEFGLVKGWEAGDKTSPALLVVQEWWGINEDIKEKAMMLHQKGNCRVFIPDLYKGKTTVEVAEAKHMYDNLDWPAAVQELVQAAEYLVSTGSPKVGAVGFCMGGSLAIAACQWGKIHAAVSCYGLPQFEICPPTKVVAPIQIHVGTKDDYVSVKSAEEFASRVNNSGGLCDLHIYEGAGHAFLNKPDKIGQAKASDKDISLAWQRMEMFLWKNVDPKASPRFKNHQTELAAWERNQSGDLDNMQRGGQQAGTVVA